MRITRVIAVTIMAATAGLTSLNAQTLRKSSPPAEFPPASYKGKQYVDSRGCIYIRAGIDGNVTWVPRVSRDRRQVCGYKPTAVAGATARPTQTANPKLITIEPTAPTATAAATAAPKPKPKAQAKPSPGPKPTVVSTPKPKTTSTPTTTVRTTTRTTTARPATATTAARPTTTRPATTVAPKPTTAAAPVVAPRRTAPAATGGGCSNASAFSQQFINKSGVRCGPQTEAPITHGSGTSRKSSSLNTAPTNATPASTGVKVSLNTRVAPRQVYDKRQNTRNVEVPKGFRSVWKDDRLNPHRAERTLRPAITVSRFEPPTGFRAVEREDDRLNPNRGLRTAAGDAQSDAIWERTIPRTLRRVPTDVPIIPVEGVENSYTNLATRPNRLTFSTRSGPTAPVEARYVRVASYQHDAAARQAAQRLSGSGLPMNVGTVRRGSGTYKVVLVGPFNSQAQAASALNQVRGAGFSGARLTK
jgi:cell division septation protein DedD